MDFISTYNHYLRCDTIHTLEVTQTPDIVQVFDRVSCDVIEEPVNPFLEFVHLTIHKPNRNYGCVKFMNDVDHDVYFEMIKSTKNMCYVNDWIYLGVIEGNSQVNFKTPTTIAKSL